MERFFSAVLRSVNPAVEGDLIKPKQCNVKCYAIGGLTIVTKATDWVHPMVVVPKPNSGIRLGIDLQKLNKYVRRVYHPSKSPPEAVSNISSSSKFFSTLNATKEYWEVSLEKESQNFTTFITPFGRYKFLRVSIELASSQDEYCAR